MQAPLLGLAKSIYYIKSDKYPSHNIDNDNKNNNKNDENDKSENN